MLVSGICQKIPLTSMVYFYKSR